MQENERRIFTFSEAEALLAVIRPVTAAAVSRASSLLNQDRVLAEWSDEVSAHGAIVKGPWLVDFDNGSGYYCWRWPEAQILFFHGYDEGFSGRMRIH